MVPLLLADGVYLQLARDTEIAGCRFEQSGVRSMKADFVLILVSFDQCLCTVLDKYLSHGSQAFEKSR